MATNTLIVSTLLHFLLAVFASTTPPYTPTDYILLDCGSSSNSTSIDYRQWQADTLSDSITKSQTEKASEQSPSLPQVPYMTARISRSEFTYSFPSLSPGPKFLRLYFYPTTYNKNFNKTEPFFSVTANQNTLLRNFSAFLTVSSILTDIVIKEYIIHINDTRQQLNITFLPNPDSYAFVNGIEIVSIPKDLYFKGHNVPIINTAGTTFSLQDDTALETLYRLNVGSVFVQPTDDTGMFRSWSPDDDYIIAAGIAASKKNVALKYTSSDPPYTAPEIVYTSARIMIDDFSRSYNMTWVFPVDSGFQYLLRLHFCEFFLEIREVGQRIFSIFINNQAVENVADVIYWANGPDTAISKDYVAYVGDKDGQKSKQDLLLTLKPASRDLSSTYDNALLNGLEIFKISRQNGSLDSPNPDLAAVSIPPLEQPTSPAKKKIKSWGLIAGGVVLVVAAAGLSGFLIFWWWRRVIKSATSVSDSKGNSNWVALMDKSRSTRTSVSSGGSLLPTELCRHFSLEEISKATGSFDDNFVIGVGGFGKVYKGYIDNGGKEVAIKRSIPSSNQGMREFFAEIVMLSKLRHVNVVSLIGYCDESGEMILVYDYMSRGTLRDHLYNSYNPPLPWKQRLQICIGAAKGLHYLHTSAKYSIIHRDVKSSNILLDEKWVAKVSDFGLSKVGPVAGVNTHVSTMVKGSFGYLDPEYYMRQQLTEKSDVYSFGVVLFEVLCSRPAIFQDVIKEHVNLANWVRLSTKNDTLYDIIDPRLKDEIVEECFSKYVEVGLRCLKHKGCERPTMNDVVWSLEFALQLQEVAEERMKSGNEEGENGNEDVNTFVRLCLHSESFTTEEDSTDIDMVCSTDASSKFSF